MGPVSTPDWPAIYIHRGRVLQQPHKVMCMGVEIPHHIHVSRDSILHSWGFEAITVWVIYNM